MIINPITQPVEFRQELQVLSAYVSNMAKATRKSYLERQALMEQYSGCLSFLGNAKLPPVGVGMDAMIKPLIGVVNDLSEEVCKAHLSACGEFSIPFSTHSFLKERLKGFDDFSADKASNQSLLDVALEHFETFNFETAFYKELAAEVNPTTGQDMAYSHSANQLIELLPWYQLTQQKSGAVFAKASHSSEQYKGSYGSLRVHYNVRSDTRELLEHLKTFSAFSGDDDLYCSFQMLYNRLYRFDDGFDLRDTVEYGGIRFVFFKNKIEIRIPDVIFGQLVTFCRVYGSEYKKENRLEPNLRKLAA